MMLQWSSEKTRTTEQSFTAANDNKVNVAEYISNCTFELAELASYFSLEELKVALISVSLEAHSYRFSEKRT